MESIDEVDNDVDDDSIQFDEEDDLMLLEPVTASLGHIGCQLWLAQAASLFGLIMIGFFAVWVYRERMGYYEQVFM